MGKILTQEQAELKSTQMGIKMIGQYNGSIKNTYFECPVCQKSFQATPGHIWQKFTTSCGCIRKGAKVENLKDKIFGKLKVIELSHISHPDKKHYNAIWKCKCECGGITFISTEVLKRKNGTQSCGCIISKGNNRICDFLNNNHIEYFREYSFEDCRHIKKLKFDIFIPSLNICVEYNGKQHYDKKYQFNHKKSESYNIIKKRDKIKKDYCKNNSIKLLEISYKDFDNIEQILKKELICQ